MEKCEKVIMVKIKNDKTSLNNLILSRLVINGIRLNIDKLEEKIKGQ
jgi:hypothetical protein